MSKSLLDLYSKPNTLEFSHFLALQNKAHKVSVRPAVKYAQPLAARKFSWKEVEIWTMILRKFLRKARNCCMGLWESCAYSLLSNEFVAGFLRIQFDWLFFFSTCKPRGILEVFCSILEPKLPSLSVFLSTSCQRETSRGCLDHNFSAEYLPV